MTSDAVNETSLPLADRIRDLIRREGPISVERFMALALADPAEGYYMTRDPFGVAGDFTTAPEISQMFGELIGLFAIGCWQTLGAPAAFRIVELGPGRGTLMRDLLRALKVMPEMRAAARIALVETSARLAARQRETLGAAAREATWHATFAAVPRDLPMIVIGNEFLDALPIRQFVLTRSGLHERLVMLGDAGRFRFGSPARSDLDDLPQPAPIFEVGRAAGEAVEGIAAVLAACRGYALFIDYGHERSRAGETLQAVRGHRFVDPLADPGAADLTAHVDFAAVARAAIAGGAAVWPLLTQATLLARLGIDARTDRLAAAAGGAVADRVRGERDRLTDLAPTGMGRLFKALAIGTPGLPAPPAFDAPDPTLAQDGNGKRGGARVDR